MSGGGWQFGFDDTEVNSALTSLYSGGLRRITRGALDDLGLLTARNASFEQIIRGGGTGKGKQTPPNPTRLTSRNGSSGLVGSITHDLLDGGKLGVRVGSNKVYSRAQELGFPPRNLPPRPYLKPALEEEVEGWQKIFARRWRAEASKNGL